MDAVTHTALAKDLYILTGQVEANNTRLTDLHDLVRAGFEDVKTQIAALEHKHEVHQTRLEERVRATETAHATIDGQHGAFSWFGDSVKLVIAAVAGGVSGHFLK